MSVALRSRPGVALLEALIAVTILASAGAGWIALAAQAESSLALAVARETRSREASQLLARYSRLGDEELEALAGRRRDGSFDMGVSILGPGLYEVTVAEHAGKHAVLRTLFYRVREDDPNER